MIDRVPGLNPEIPLCAPELSGQEWQFVREALDTGWVSSAGPFVDRLEREMAERIGHSHGVATCSGTAALHLALLVAGVRPGDEVLVSDLTFVAPANCIRYVGAEPVLVDCDPATLQMDVSLVVDFLADCKQTSAGLFNSQTGRRVAAVIPVHLLGHPVDMAPLLEICQRLSVPVIEDASESLGARYQGQPVGSHGTIACFSFNGNKIVTAGGGGTLLTNDPGLAARARYLSTQAKDDPVYYLHESIGFNYRLTNLQAALAVAQLQRLEEFTEKKRELAGAYDAFFSSKPVLVETLPAQPWAFSTCWLYTILLRGKAAQQQRALITRLAEQRIQLRPLWNPMHCNKPFQNCQQLNRGTSLARLAVERSVSLPSSVGLSGTHQQSVCQAIGDFLSSFA